jgi:hypothetical protein
MTRPHHALISISVEFTAGLEKVRALLGELRQYGDISGVSSVYKRFLTSRHEDLNSDICLVIKMDTDISHGELQQKLEEINAALLQNLRKQGQTLLLSYDRMVQLLPASTLPHPLLRNDGLTLRCAAEVWGGYEHPVLGQTLNELVKSSEPIKTSEFFAQGKSL